MTKLAYIYFFCIYKLIMKNKNCLLMHFLTVKSKPRHRGSIMFNVVFKFYNANRVGHFQNDLLTLVKINLFKSILS